MLPGIMVNATFRDVEPLAGGHDDDQATRKPPPTYAALQHYSACRALMMLGLFLVSPTAVRVG